MTNSEGKIHNIKNLEEKICREIEKLFWIDLHNESNSKLRTYKLIKNSYQCENYIKMNAPAKYIKALAKIRLSDHELEIERGRYHTPKTPLQERKCQYCNTLEDEKHFLLECENYRTERETMNKSITHTKIPEQRDSGEKMSMLLNPKCEKSLKAVAKYIILCKKVRLAPAT